MKCPACGSPIVSGLIFCGSCWGRLPNEIKAKLIWLHPDVARMRKTPVRAGAYDELLKTAVAYLGNR